MNARPTAAPSSAVPPRRRAALATALVALIAAPAPDDVTALPAPAGSELLQPGRPTTLWRGPGSALVVPPDANGGAGAGSMQAGTAEPGLHNGGFLDGLEAWLVTESGGATQPGSVTLVDGQAQLLEGDSFLVSLSQTFVVPEGALSLSFDLYAVPGLDTTDDFLPDAFEVHLLAPGDFPAVDPWAVFATSFFNLQEDGSLNLGPTTEFDGVRVHVPLDGVPADSVVTLVFDLIGADLDTAGGMRIGDVALQLDCGVSASWSHYGSAWPGPHGAPSLTPLSDRVIGQSFQIEITNPTGVDADAIGFIGLAPAALATGYGGELLLDPLNIIAFTLPAAGLIVTHDNDADLALCGLPVYSQVVLVDAGASHGFAFSAGLETIIGSTP